MKKIGLWMAALTAVTVGGVYASFYYSQDVAGINEDKNIIMIKFTLAGLLELGFSKEQVYTTMELRMKCGVGKCGRCNIGSKYVCKDGPVFRFDELDQLPDEY